MFGARRKTSEGSQNKNRVKKTLFENVFLYVTTNRDPFSIHYSVECSRFTNVQLTMDFSKSKNVSFHASPALLQHKLKDSSTEISSLKVEVKIRAFTSLDLGTIRVVDNYKGASVGSSYSYCEEEPDEAEILQYLQIHHAEIQQKISETRSLYGSMLANKLNTTFTPETMKEVFSQYGKSFIDMLFLPAERSIFHSSEHIARMQDDDSENRLRAIEWKRPSDFMKVDEAIEGSAIQVFQGGIEPADIIQGQLGDCWFLSSLAAIAEVPVLVEALFPPSSREFTPAGMYEVRFCKNGLWQTIHVDDYFPCFPGSGPIFSRSHGNELWVLLAEKAYAKLHHSYLAIQSGLSVDALTDLTGAPFKVINFPSIGEEQSNEEINAEEVWRLLLDGEEKGYLMSAGTRSQSELLNSSKSGQLERPISTNSIGLVFGHAYTVITALVTTQGDRLVKIRNPWGAMEWNGDWSDKSDKWTPEMRAEVGNVVEADDGVFWMAVSDFLYYFDHLNICMVRIPTVNSPTPWYEHRHPFAFELSSPEAEEITSFMFRVVVQQRSHFIFTIHQKDVRCPNVPDYLDVGFVLLREVSSGQYELVDGKSWKWKRQVQSDEVEVDAGTYLFVPLSSGYRLRQFRSNATASNDVKSLVVHGEERGGLFLEFPVVSSEGRKLQLSNTAIDIYTDIFRRLDKDCSGYLSKRELDEYMIKTTGNPMSGVTYQYLVDNFEHTPSDKPKRGLSLSGFLAGQIFIFNQILATNGNNIAAVEEIFHKEIEAFGYDRHTYQWTSGRCMVFSLHSTVKDFKVTAVPYDSAIAQLAQEMFISQRGNRKEYGGKVAMYSLSNGYEGSSIVIENLQEAKNLEITMDISGSENVTSHHPTNEMKHHAVVPPKRKHVMFHLLPKDTTQAWSSSYRFEYS